MTQTISDDQYNLTNIVRYERGRMVLAGPSGLMFHHFHNFTHPRAQGSISSEELVAIIEAISPSNILRADEFVERSIVGQLPENSVCLTFDDNLRCQFDVALPVLNTYGLTAIWNINTAPLVNSVDRLELYRHFRMNAFANVDAFYSAFFDRLESGTLAIRLRLALDNFDPDKYLREHEIYSRTDRQFRYVRDHVLTSEEYFAIMDGMIIETPRYSISDAVRSLWMTLDHLNALIAGGHMIGLHTHTHPTNIAAMSRAAQHQEYSHNRDTLSTLLNVSPIVMSHPNGSYNNETIEIIRELGIKVAFRADPYLQNPSLLELPRYDHSELFRVMNACAPKSLNRF